MNIVEVFTRVNGRPPTDADQRRIIQMANALGANGQDTFLCLLIALDHYYGLYDKIPAKIAAEAEALERGGPLPEPMERGELAHAMSWNVAQGRLLASRYAAAPPEFLQRLFAVQRAYLTEQQLLREEYDAAHASLAAAVAREVHGME